MVTKCINLNKDAINALREFGGLDIGKNGKYSKELAEAVFSKLANNNEFTVSDNDIEFKLYISRHRQRLEIALNNALVEKLAEMEKLKELKEGVKTIEGVPLKVGNKWKKNTPRDNKKVLYIYPENLQAYNATASKEEDKVLASGLIEVEGGPKLNVNGSAAIVRMTDDNHHNENVASIVTKKNAQNEKGDFIHKEGAFTKEDEKEFLEVNRRAVKRIKELLKSGNFERVEIVDSLALTNSGLPLELANALSELLNEELGLRTSIEKHSNNSKYEGMFGLKILNGMSLKKEKEDAGEDSGDKKDKKDKKSKKEIERENARKAAIESLKAIRPIIDKIKEDVDNRTLLTKIFPDIEKRRARVDFIVNRFSDILSYKIDEIKKKFSNEEYLNTLDEDERYETQEILTNLTSGTESEQRVYALGNIKESVDGNVMSLGEYIFYEIKNQMQIPIDIINSLGDLSTKTDKELEDINRQLLLYITSEGADNTYLASGFLTKALDYGWASYEEKDNGSGKWILTEKGEKEAIKYIHNLARAFSPILNMEGAYDALVSEAAADLEFNENIRLSFDKKSVVQTAQDLENIDEEGKVEDRSGLNLIKYKLMDPAKSLSIRIKTMLSRLYKTNPNSGEFSSGVMYIYDDLGQRQRINSGYAYYVLLSEFSEMKGPQDLMPIMDKAIEKYAWMSNIKEQLEQDTDLRNEFFRAMNRVFSPAAMITGEGNLKKLNRVNTIESFMNEVQKNYEGHVVLGTHSIYNDEGECVRENVQRIYRLIDFGKDKAIISDENIKKKHPIAWARKILGSRNQTAYNLENLKEAFAILNGVSEVTGKSGSLELLLRNLGIDTSNINLSVIAPKWEDIEARMKYYKESNEDKSDLELFEMAYPKENRQSLLDLLGNGVYYIVAEGQNNDKGFRPGQHLVSSYSSAYSVIARNLTIAGDGYTQASYTFNGEQRYSYCPPDFISNLVKAVQDNSEEGKNAMKYLFENYLKYRFYNNNTFIDKDGNIIEAAFEDNIPTLLEDLYMNPETRKYFTYYNVLGIGSQGSRGDDNTIQNVSNEDFVDGLVVAMFNGDKTKNGVYGLFRNPLFSDTDALVLFQAPREVTDSSGSFEDKIIAKLSRVLQNEIERIIKSNDTVGTTVEHYNDKRNNSSKFLFFPSLNSIKEEFFEGLKNTKTPKEYNDYLKATVAKILETQCAEFVDSIDPTRRAALYKKVTRLAQAKEEEEGEEDQSTSLEDLFKEENKDESSEKEKAEISEAQKKLEIDMLRQFYYNDYYMQTQLIQILGGDLAYFKNFQDFIKRNKQSYAAGERIWSLDEEGNPLVNRAMYLEDLDAVANTYQQIEKLLKSAKDLSDIDRAFIRGALAKFGNITSTDGQSFRTLKSFKKVLKAMGGKWTEDMERSYNNILNNKRLTMEDFNNFWNSIKPFVYTHEDRVVNGRLERVNIQYKNSEYMLSALYGVLNTALNSSPQLVGLHKFMDKYDIDVAHFHSSVKIGYNNPFDINYKNGQESYKRIEKAKKSLEKGEISQEEFNSIVSGENYQTADEVVEALENQLKSMEDEANKTREQLKERYDEGRLGETEYNRMDAAINVFHETPFSDYMVVQPSDNHLTDAEALFGSQLRNIIPADLPEDFTLELSTGNKKVILNREQAIHYYNVLIMDQLLDSFSELNSKFSNAQTLSSYLQDMMKNNPKYGDDIKMALQLNEDGTGFRLPFNSPNLSNKINELLLSAFKNTIQRQKVKGGNAVLVSNFGLSDNLHIKYKNDNPEEGIEYIPAYMPFYMKDMIADYLEGNEEDGYTIDFEKAKDNIDEDLLKVIGYRIPTENKYSIMPIKIVGFLPVSCGTGIMLPNEIITMSGTDFDIDKLFLMIREGRRERAGAIVAETYYKWLEFNNKTIKDKTVDSLTNGYSGYTYDEILNLYNKDADFKQFWEEEGYKLLWDFPKYKMIRPKYQYKSDGTLDIDATSKMESVKGKKNKKKLRNNMLIDTIWGIMTSPAGSRLSMNPGSYDNVSHSSELQNILNNPIVLHMFVEKYNTRIEKEGIWKVLNSLSTKELEDFFEEYGGSSNDPNSIQSYISNHRNLMDGNALIGAFAINSSSHYKYQFLNLKIHKMYRFKIQPLGEKPVVIEDIDRVYSPINGNLIGRICAEFQAASPDNGKDPRLGKMGVNLSNVYLVDFLSRIGLDPQSIGVLLRCDDLRVVGHALRQKNKPNIAQLRSSFSGNIEEIVEQLVKLRTKGMDEIDEDFAMGLDVWMYNIETLAQSLNDSNAISKVDSPNSALAVDAAEAIQQRLRAEDFINAAKKDGYPIQGFGPFIDIDLDAKESSMDEVREKCMKAPIPRMQAFYTLGMKSALSLVGQHLSCVQGNTVEAVRYLRNQVQSPMTFNSSLPWLKKFYSELNTYLLAKNSIFATDKEGKSMIDKRNYYIHDFPIKFYDFLESKKEGRYIHEAVRNLTFIKRLSNASGEGITVRNASVKTSPQSRKHYNEEFESLLFGDADTQNIGMDLILYAYYSSGLNFGHSNIANFITTIMMEKVPRFIESLKENTNRWMNDPNMIREFTRLFLLNHYQLIPRINTKNFSRSADGETITAITKKDIEKLKSGIVKQHITPIDLIRDNKYVYERVKNIVDGKEDFTKIEYRRVQFNKTAVKASLYTPLYSLDENGEPEFDKMQSKGELFKAKKGELSARLLLDKENKKDKDTKEKALNIEDATGVDIKEEKTVKVNDEGESAQSYGDEIENPKGADSLINEAEEDAYLKFTNAANSFKEYMERASAMYRYYNTTDTIEKANSLEDETSNIGEISENQSPLLNSLLDVLEDKMC